ncbi:MAG: C40 family peptidase [Bacteroidota bacterium]
MKRSIDCIVIGIILTGLTWSCSSIRHDVETAGFLIDSVKRERIPDSRVALFSIEATGSPEGVVLKGKTTEPEALSHLLEHLNEQKIHCIDSVLRLPDAKLGDHIWGLVTISVANIRYKPAHSAEMATQALMGTPLQVLQEESGWYLVRTPDRYISWTESPGIVTMTEQQQQNWKQNQRVIFVDDYGLVLSRPNIKAEPVSDIVMGGILSVMDTGQKTGEYTGVMLPDGRKGYLPVNQVKMFSEWLINKPAGSEQLTTLARGFMGRPYLWGGTSAKGFDCSGFTKTLYFMNGWVLSRDASQQVYQGSEISLKDVWSNLHPGDLLFFGRKATAEKPERATHVGMYEGDSFFVHCSGMVKINSLDSTRPEFKEYYTENLLHVKRILNSDSQPVRIKDHPWYN